MYEIVKTYKQEVGATRFIGIKYGDEDRVNGTFGAKWDEWFQKGLFEKLETSLSEEFKKSYEDSDAYIGLMRWKEGEKFEYWIGMFLPEGTAVPDGYAHVDFSPSNLGVCWIRGDMSEVFCKEDKCAERLSKEGFEVITDNVGAWWFFERYGCPRFTEKDEEGKFILDICHFIK
jgi:hypothetical protein